jgi:hypothetical protein
MPLLACPMLEKLSTRDLRPQRMLLSDLGGLVSPR